MLPHAQTLSRLLTALPAASPVSAEVAVLLRAVRENPAPFALGPPTPSAPSA